MTPKVKQVVKDYFVMTVGAGLFAFAWEGLVIPNNMSSGGLMGLCTIIQYATGGLLSASVSYMALNVLLLIFAFLAMGLGFGIKTIYCIAMTSVLMQLFSGLEWLHAVPGSVFYIQDPVLVPLLAGLLEGLGLGLVFKYDGSTGGLDIVALFVNRHWPISTGRFFMICDCIIITSIVALPGKSLGDMAYGYLMMVVSAWMVDFITLGAKSSVQMLVFSSRYQEIADHIINNLDRGVTVLHAQGWYTKQEKDVLLVILRKKQLYGVTKLIKSVDPNAFVSVCQTSSVYGEGFEEIKAGIEKKKISDGTQGS